jgi:hypothetical protein
MRMTDEHLKLLMTHLENESNRQSGDDGTIRRDCVRAILDCSFKHRRSIKDDTQAFLLFTIKYVKTKKHDENLLPTELLAEIDTE